MSAKNNIELTPGMLYRATCSLGLFNRCVQYEEENLVIIPIDSVLMFLKEIIIKRTGCTPVCIKYFLYGHQLVYDHRYNTEKYKIGLEELT